MLKKSCQHGFAPIIVVLIMAIMGSAVVIVENLPRDNNLPSQPQRLSTQATESAKVQPSSSPTAIKTQAKSPSPTPKKQLSTTPTSNPTNSNNSSSNSSASTNQNTNASQSNNVNNTCDKNTTICFDNTDVSMTVKQGQNQNNGGWTELAFKLTGKGSKGFTINSNLPPGFSLTPSSGAFGDGTSQDIKVWVNKDIASSGQYPATVSLKVGNSDGSYSNSPYSLKLNVRYEISSTPSPTPANSVRIISPNGGESFKVGDTVHITWDASGTFNIFIISAVDTYGTGYNIGSVSDPNARSYDWTANIGNSSSQQLKLQITANKYPKFVGDETIQVKDAGDGLITVSK